MTGTPDTERNGDAMEENKNVLLTIVHKDEEHDDELYVDFAVIWKYVKRMFIVWLCLAVGIGFLSGGAALLVQDFTSPKEVRTLIRFSNEQLYDVNKITSPSVVQDALNARGIDGTLLEDFQKAVTIQGVIPDSVYERMSMYYNVVLSKSTDTKLIDSLLDTQYQVLQYVVSFNYAAAGLTREEGIAFLNELMRAYRDYCALNYNYNTSLNNPLSAVDYHNYDYAEAVDIFSKTLDNISSYLQNILQKTDGAFRSTRTGFTFQDLSRTASLLKEIDLDRVSSYIVIHSVSAYDAETEISYYQWLIENLTRQRAIERTRLSSLTASIDSYEKDSLVIVSGAEGDSAISGSEDINANYDNMITEKLASQSQIASYTRSISYYESVIEGFQNSGSSSDAADTQQVAQYLDDLNEAVNRLIRNISLTVDEYYETAAFFSQAQTLVPATAKDVPIISDFVIKVTLAVQALLFLFYLGAAVVLALRESNSSRRMKEQKAPL